MRKVVLQGAATILLFFAIWFVLKQVDWMTILRFEKNKDNIEEGLGKMITASGISLNTTREKHFR